MKRVLCLLAWVVCVAGCDSRELLPLDGTARDASAPDAAHADAPDDDAGVDDAGAKSPASR